jgi:hypothetical protein
MKPVLLVLVLTTTSVAGNAADTQENLSADSDPFYAGKTKDTTAYDQAAHCKELRRQMAELTGSPQRRHAVSQRYQLECTPARQMPGQPGLQ